MMTAPRRARRSSRGEDGGESDDSAGGAGGGGGTTPLKGAKSTPQMGSPHTPGSPPWERPGRGAGGGGRPRKWWLPLLALVALAGLFATLRPGASGPPAALLHTSFVQVSGNQLSLDCRPFYVAGFSIENIAQAPLPQIARKLADGRGGVALVRSTFQQAAAAGLNVVRTFAHTTDPAYPLQVRPGQYDEDAFRGLDIVIAEAERAGLRVILSLADSWKYYGGVDEFVDWSASAPAREPRFPPTNKLGDVSVEDWSADRLAYENRRKALFFSDEGTRRMFKAHVRAILQRRNTVSGRLYKQDPTLLAFDLLNEPRCSAYETPQCTDLVQKWTLDMAQHFKSLDQTHLLAVGSEGFWGERDAFRDMNPGAPGSDWASKSGQDFIAANSLPQIDIAVMHLWPTNWAVAGNLTFSRQWIEKHVEDCETLLKKPCLLEEYGHALGTRGLNPPAEVVAKQRDPVFASVLAAVEDAVGSRRPLAGSLFWRWGLSIYKNDVPGPYGILPEHSTFKLLSEHAQRLRAHALAAPPAADCPAAECWVPTSGRWLRRCEHRPSVCAAQRARRHFHSSAMKEGGQLAAPGSPAIYASQASCCRPGLGAFPAGCSTTWF